MDKEPIITVSMVTAFISGVLGLAVAFGVSVTPEQQQAVLTLTGAVCALIIGMGFFGRRFVYSEETHNEEVNAAYEAGHEDGSTMITITADPPPSLVTFPPVAPEPDVAAIIADAQNASFSDPQEEIDLDDDDHSPVVV